VHRLGEIHRRFVVPLCTHASKSFRLIGEVDVRVERAQPQRAIRIILGDRRIAAERIHMCAEVKRGGARGVQGERAGDRSQRRRKIVTQMQERKARDGERRGVVAAVRQRGPRMTHTFGRVGLRETPAHEADFQGPRQIGVGGGIFGIDIAFPPQLYSDVLHFGQASTARPENVAKMLAAVKAEDGEALLRLYTEALADFEHKRVTILNPALLDRPRAMPLEAPPSGPPELDDGGGEPEDLDLMQIDLIEEGSDMEMPLEAPPSASGPPEPDDGGDEPEDLDFMEIDLVGEATDSEAEASRPSTLAKTKPTSPLVKAKSKLGKKSPNLKGAAPQKLGRPKPFSKS
jgi:hypothetical protein